MAEYDDILIVCIDRDGDLVTKIGKKGPISGREKVFEAATTLALADPTESDANVLFAGIKLFDQLKDTHKNIEVTVLTGSKKVGYESDMIISRQLDKVLKKYPADGAIIVTDGAEDEHVLPIIESRIKIITLERVVVKQSEALESTYYLIIDFLKEVLEDPKQARLLLGIPGVGLILIMVLWTHAWRVILGVFGILLVIRGFDLEEPLERNITGLRKSLVTDKATFFTYIIAALVGIVGILRGYQALGDSYYPSYIDALPVFISASKDLLTSAGLLALAGRSIDAIIEGRGLGKYLILGTFLVSLWFIVGSISVFILGKITISELVISAAIGAALSLTAFLLRRAISKEE
jgi:putative membrane protein